MTITGRQIRAARGLLDWTQDDLAAKSELNRLTIRQIESEQVTPHDRTLVKLSALFDKFGVEFLPENGLKLRKQETRTYSGKAGYRQLLDHIYETLKDGGHIRQFNVGDMRYLPYADSYVAEHIERMSSLKGIDGRVLEMAGETKNPVSYCEYRYLDKQFEGMAPWYLYGDNLIIPINEAGGSREFVTVHSKLVAERYLNEFDIFWKLAKKKKAK